MSLSVAAIPAIAYAVDPYTPNELDGHADAARVWATVEAARQEVRAEIEDEEEEADELRGIICDARASVEEIIQRLKGEDVYGIADGRSDEERIKDALVELGTLFLDLEGIPRYRFWPWG